jgi:hypothetical protein
MELHVLANRQVCVKVFVLNWRAEETLPRLESRASIAPLLCVFSSLALLVVSPTGDTRV